MGRILIQKGAASRKCLGTAGIAGFIFKMEYYKQIRGSSKRVTSLIMRCECYSFTVETDRNFHQPPLDLWNSPFQNADFDQCQEKTSTSCMPYFSTNISARVSRSLARDYSRYWLFTRHRVPWTRPDGLHLCHVSSTHHPGDPGCKRSWLAAATTLLTREDNGPHNNS